MIGKLCKLRTGGNGKLEELEIRKLVNNRDWEILEIGKW